MTPQQISQVQTSFAKIVPIADQAAALFYARLFETAPKSARCSTATCTSKDKN